MVQLHLIIILLEKQNKEGFILENSIRTDPDDFRQSKRNSNSF
jgi:hypothetical protein